MSDAWPFAVWLKTAVSRYGLSPSDFWSMSVIDWRMLTQSSGTRPMSRHDFDALTHVFPDKEMKDE